MCAIAGGVIVLAAWSGAALDDLPRDTINAESLWTVPRGLPDDGAADVGADERARVALGRRLFFDPILSREGDRACATCHRPDHGFASPEARPAARGGGELDRNAPTLLNRAYGTSQMWDGRFATLQDQALSPIENERELGLPVAEALRRLGGDDAYRSEFEAAFGRGPDRETLATALASFIGRLRYGDTPMDRFRMDGKVFALTSDERAGMWIFQSKAGCWQCHHGFNFTDEAFHNTGVGAVDGLPEPGRMVVTGEASDAGRFKTPTLRALLQTPPYFHDGSAATLRAVVEFYNRGGEPNEHLDRRIRALSLSKSEIDQVVAFLGTLSRREGP